MIVSVAAVMFPFSYSCERFPPDAEDLYEALLGATKSLRNVRGTEYMTGQACELVYRAPGDSSTFPIVRDWLHMHVADRFIVPFDSRLCVRLAGHQVVVLDGAARRGHLRVPASAERDQVSPSATVSWTCKSRLTHLCLLTDGRPVGEETTEALFYLAKFVEKVRMKSLLRRFLDDVEYID